MAAWTITVQMTEYRILIVALLIVGYFVVLMSMWHDTATQFDPKTNDFIRSNVPKQYENSIEDHSMVVALTDKLLKAQNEISELQTKLQHQQISNIANIVPPSSTLRTGKGSPAEVSGVVILGMHRSGTSVLGGLLNQMGLKTGGPLIPPAKDNEKGFFERIDVVLQNDEFMTDQRIYYGRNTYKYDSLAGLRLALNALHIESEEQFAEGRRALGFLNNPDNYPYMLKDPRLCITFRTWLPLLSSLPAVVFTYRHPLDVALSLNKRETEHFLINYGLRLWYVYNKRAIQQSHDLCRVIASHRNVMTLPQQQLDRIFEELHACGVRVPHKASSNQIESFIDTKLQHGKSTIQDDSCTKDVSTLHPPSTWPTNDENHIKLYREVMRVYCAMEDGSAFSPNFQWDEEIHDV